MMNRDKQLFKILDKKTQEKYKHFAKFYKNDVKSFVNKISRDYEKTGEFPSHVLKQIKKIRKEDYYCAVCILRGGLPYSILFEAAGWKVYYVRCGRTGEYSPKDRKDLRFDKNVDKNLKSIKDKKILLIDNNSPTGNTPLRTFEELKKNYNIKRPDLFLDYYFYRKTDLPSWLKRPFWRNKPRMNKFDKIFIASDLKVSNKEHKRLVNEYLEKLK